MPDREPIKASEQYLKDKFGKFIPWKYLYVTGKLTSMEVQNPCWHPQVITEHPFSVIGIWWLRFRDYTSIAKLKTFAMKNIML